MHVLSETYVPKVLIIKSWYFWCFYWVPVRIGSQLWKHKVAAFISDLRKPMCSCMLVRKGVIVWQLLLRHKFWCFKRLSWWLAINESEMRSSKKLHKAKSKVIAFFFCFDSHVPDLPFEIESREQGWVKKFLNCTNGIQFCRGTDHPNSTVSY